MRTVLKKTAAVVLCLCLLFGLGACRKNEEPSLDAIDQIEGIIAGAWEEADSPVVTEELQAKFDKALEGLTGANYTPVAYLGSQIVSGHNYLLLCRVAPVVANPVETYAVVQVYEDAEGNLQLVDTSDFGVETYLGGENLAGGWSEPETVELTDDILEAYEKAQENSDADYTPLAVIGQQVVAGMNYRILAELKNVEPGHATNYVIVTLYKALDGSAEITDVAKMPAQEW